MYIEDLIVLHWEKPIEDKILLIAEDLNKKSQGVLRSPFFSLKTCLRQIIVGWIDDGIEYQTFSDNLNAEILKGEQAYSFLLEVASGMKSPMFGETEILGQVKEAIKAFTIEHVYWQHRFKKFFSIWLEDVKQVRHKNLQHCVQPSYGGILRKEFRGAQNIVFLGAGQLVKEMLPWILKSENNFYFIVRDVFKVKQEFAKLLTEKQFKKVNILQKGNNQEIFDKQTYDLVIAAPLESSEIEFLIHSQNVKPRKIFDLRGESSKHPLNHLKSYCSLQDIFNRVQSQTHQLSHIKGQALKHCIEIASKRFLAEEFHPLGWEEFCN